MRNSRARLGVFARLIVAAVLLIGVLFIAVFPTRTLLDQRNAIASVQERLDVLRHENARMRERIRGLSDPQQIERIAREEYNLAKPGEEIFVIVPSEMEAMRRSGGPQAVAKAIREAWGLPLSPGE